MEFPARALTLGTELAILSPASRCCGASEAIRSTAGTTLTLGGTNRSVYYSFVLSRPFLVKQIGWANGGVVSGNVDAGIYDLGGTRIISTGSTAQSGGTQVTDTADTWLNPGYYFMALGVSSATAQFWGWAGGAFVYEFRGMGCMGEATFPLPATATFAEILTINIPAIVICGAGVI
jgi:hypothetical protein